MFHCVFPRRPLGGTYLSHFRASAFPLVVVQDTLCSVHAATAVRGQLRCLCCIKVNLTMGLAGPARLNKVTSLQRGLFTQVAAHASFTRLASNSLVIARGGVGICPSSANKISSPRAGVLS